MLVFSSTKLVIGEEQDCLELRRGRREEDGVGEQGVEVAQTMYAHVN
jgi:hypothetical protein